MGATPSQTAELTGAVPGIWLQRTTEGIPVLFLHFSADPDKNPEWARGERRKFTSQAFWNREMEMQDHALDGQLVYPEFSRAVHVIPDTQIPRSLCRYMSIDPHPRTPHAMLWVGIDAWGDFYVYRELWPSVVCGISRTLKDLEGENEYTVKEYAETIATLEGNDLEWHNSGHRDKEFAVYRRRDRGENVIYRFMDQAGKAFKASDEAQFVESYARRYDRYGLQCSDPRKSHESGEDAIRELLRVRYHDTRGQWPTLHIAATCKELQLEFERHRYKATRHFTDEKDLKQQGVEARCHLLDNLRYLACADIGFIPSLVS